ncbi:exocyst complex component Sec5-domain-containing protein [Scheffersomyces amazonensis]|uniref:exocyst complex component Sec5-domain-containing protein n=1 Tax=Scheffersomyces amazonensis TaxID=1078765 RepID=UPI00315DA3D9
MLIPDYSRNELLKFYNLETLEPVSKDQLNLTSQEFVDADEILEFSEAEQFSILNRLVNPKAIHHNDDSNNNNTINIEDNEDVKNGIVEDPLRGKNIIQELIRNQVIKASNDPEVNNYLISSQRFNSLKFLTTVHADSSIEQLAQSLSFLEKNIRGQTTELIGAIDSNFGTFINCKREIDAILEEFKSSKTKAQQDYDNSRVFDPSRQPVRSLKDSSLSSELEEAIKNLNYTTSRMIQPVVENKNKEAKLNKLIDFVKANSFFFDLPNQLIHHLSNHQHDEFINDYNKYLSEKQAFIMARNSHYKRELARLTNANDEAGIRSLNQETDMLTTAISKVFTEVENITQQFKKKSYNELLSMDHEVSSTKNSKSSSNDKFLALVSTIHSLEREQKPNANANHPQQENPVYEFLVAQLSNIDKELDHQIAKFDSKFRMMQLKLLDSITIKGSHVRYIAEKYYSAKSGIIASKSNSSTSSSTTSTPHNNENDIKFIMDIFNNIDNLDLSLVNESWLVLNNFIGYLDDLFLQNLTKFTNNYRHYYQINNVDPHGKIRDLFIELVSKVSNVLVTLFECEVGDNEVTQLDSSPSNYKLFLPHFTNSLSAIYYVTSISFKLNKVYTNLGKYTGLVGNLTKYNDTSKIIKTLKNGSAKTSQRLIEAVCAVWINDCSQFYQLQDWKTESTDDDLDDLDKDTIDNGAIHTSILHIIEYYQTYILTKIGQLVFVKEDTSSDIRIVQSYPSKRTLMSIEIQFMRSLNILVDSIMKKYNIERSLVENNGTNHSNRISTTGTSHEGSKILHEAFKVLTMNDLDKLSRVTYPKLISKFDEIFNNTLRNQNLKLYADIDKANITIFDDIINREKLLIANEINLYFHDSNRPPETASPSLYIDGFIFLILIHFVKLIKKVKPITGQQVFLSIINELQATVLKSILDNLRTSSSSTSTHTQLNSFELVKLKLDVNFFFKVFDRSQKLRFNDVNFKVLEVLINTVDEHYNNLPGSKFDYNDKEFRTILNDSLRTSENEFDCF